MSSRLNMICICKYLLYIELKEDLWHNNNEFWGYINIAFDNSMVEKKKLVEYFYRSEAVVFTLKRHVLECVDIFPWTTLGGAICMVLLLSPLFLGNGRTFGKLSDALPTAPFLHSWWYLKFHN